MHHEHWCSSHMKDAPCSFGEDILIGRESSSRKLNKQTLKDNTTQYCLYVADPATFLASNSALGILFSSENSLFIQLWKKHMYFWVVLLQLPLNRWIEILLSPLNTDFQQKQTMFDTRYSQPGIWCLPTMCVRVHIWLCLCFVLVCSNDSEGQRNIRRHSPDCGLLPGLYAFSSPSPPRSLVTHCPPWPAVELSLHYPPLTCTPSTPQAVVPLPRRRSTSPSSRLFWGPELRLRLRLRLRLLDSPSLHCDTLFPSVACCPPANRDWWGGTDRCETRPSSGAHRTRPRSLTSLSQLHSPQQTRGEGGSEGCKS